MQSKQASLHVVSLDYQKSIGFDPDMVVIHYITKKRTHALRNKLHSCFQE